MCGPVDDTRSYEPGSRDSMWSEWENRRSIERDRDPVISFWWPVTIRPAYILGSDYLLRGIERNICSFRHLLVFVGSGKLDRRYISNARWVSACAKIVTLHGKFRQRTPSPGLFSLAAINDGRHRIRPWNLAVCDEDHRFKRVLGNLGQSVFLIHVRASFNIIV